MSRVAYVVYRQAYYDTGELCIDGRGDDLGSRVALGRSPSGVARKLASRS